MSNRFSRAALACALFILGPLAQSIATAQDTKPTAGLYDRSNLTAWCIVPFDSKKRGPEARAEMLTRLGIFKLAYDWRAEHIPTFDEELTTLKRWNIQLTAFWFPAELNSDAQAILDALKRNNVQCELWVSMNGGEIQCTPEEQKARVESHAKALQPIIDAAAAIGCRVGLYNHGGWFGEPENQIEIIKVLNAPNVGIVYNLHHGHPHLDRLPQLLQAMMPYLYYVNLNGMVKDGEALGKKILPLGTGAEDLRVLQQIKDSGYKGPIGILGHTMDDAEETLADNLDGLDWLVPQLDGKPAAGPRPPLRVGSQQSAVGVPGLAPEFGLAMDGSLLADGKTEFGSAPITVEVRARLRSQGAYNILVANDTKASGAHWEVFTEAGSGILSVYTPGLEPDHLRTDKAICDGAWHDVAMQYSGETMRLYLDGALVGEHAVKKKGMPTVPGGLGIGRLVEGGFFCDGEIDDVRISSGIRDIAASQSPRVSDATTLGIWNFDNLPKERTTHRADVEDPARREALPEFQIIPAAKAEALTSAQSLPTSYFDAWTRSHGNAHNTRFSPAKQITRDNVSALKVAWDFRSNDGPGNVQCNPIVVDGTFYGPTSGNNIVALNASTGEEYWRFNPGALPAHRGLTYWAGAESGKPRLLFTAGDYLWMLDPKSGKPVDSFGDQGKLAVGEVRVAPAIFKNTVVVANYTRDVSGYDLTSGNHLWTFHTLPTGDEYGADTWSAPEEGANCWGGIAIDDLRGIVYVSTGSPKPNFAGNTHTGQNLFANCVIAIDVITGKRLWHFQEIRHDIWDLDIPAPPTLVTIDWQGRRVDAVAQVTKLANTLLLDRVTGEPLFPVRLRRAPVSTVPGERTWPYQPDIQLPEPFARQNFSLDDVTKRTEDARNQVLGRLANATMGWFKPLEENKPTVFYNIHGGAEWTGAAFNPESGKLYVSANNLPWIVTLFQPDEITRNPNSPPTRGQQVYEENCVKCHGPNRQGVGMNPPLQGLARRLNDEEVLALLKSGKNLMPALPPTVSADDQKALLDYIFLRDIPKEQQVKATTTGPARYIANGYPKLLDHEGYPGCTPPWGTLNCIDLASGKLEWQVPLGFYPDLAEWGDDKTGAENFGGPSVTAGGLVFCAGTPDNLIRAFDAKTGEELWSHDLPFGGYAPPTIYQVDGKEFVVIAATGGGKLGTPVGDAYVAFSLD